MTDNSKSTSGKYSILEVRMNPDDHALIEAAAKTQGKTAAAFMLEPALKRAADVILNQRSFALTADQTKMLDEMLANPPEPNDVLKELMQTRAPWEPAVV